MGGPVDPLLHTTSSPFYM